MDTLFWISVCLIVFVYGGYPLLLAVWSAVAGRPVRVRPLPALFERDRRSRALTRQVDVVRDRYGERAVLRAAALR